MVEDISKYGIAYPELCVDIVNYFGNDKIRSKSYEILKQRLGDGLAAKIAKSTLDFALYFGNKYKKLDNYNTIIQPKTISKICDILCNLNVLSKIHVAGFNTFFEEEFYYKIPKNIPNTIDYQKYLNNRVYGFKYIYQSYKNNVLPIYVYNKQTCKQQTGTCFKTHIGIITAKHCLKNQNYAQISTIKANILKNSKILVNSSLDLLLIKPKDYEFNDYIEFGTGEIIDEIMVMGYPKHAGFGNFLTATTGQIAGIETCYLYGHELMLLTGKIKGGNSGGPVLNNKGQVVGIVTETPESEGDYDKFGYGLAIPFKYIDNLEEIYDKKITFVDDISEALKL